MARNRKKLCENEMVTISAACRERFLSLSRPELGLLADAGVTFSGASILHPQYDIARDKPQWHTMMYTLAGEGHLVTGGQEYRLKPNTIYIAPAGVEHHYWIEKAPWHLAWACISPDNRLRFSPSTPMVIHSQSPSEFDHTIRQIIEESDTRRAECSAMMEGYSRLLYLIIKRDIMASHLPPIDDRQIIFQQVLREVRNHPAHKWTVESLLKSSRIPVSKDRFCQLCAVYLGKTPLNMVKNVRMETAREILSSTDYYVYTIAGMVGYENEYAFSAAFHRETGHSPRQYRAQCRE
jgi:AraC-like DNA-binding protein